MKLKPHQPVVISVLVALALASAGCDRAVDEAKKRITPEYDKATGKKGLENGSHSPGCAISLRNSSVSGSRPLDPRLDLSTDYSVLTTPD